MTRLTRTCVLIAAVALLAAVPAQGSGDGPHANSARKCGLSSYAQRHLGTTYVLTLRVSGTKCKYGKKVVRAYHACRHKHGRAGHCSGVYGYHCTERRFNKIPSQYDARARCKKAGREVFHIYTQNT